MKVWSDWIDNKRIGRKPDPDLVGQTVRVENSDRTISTGKAEDFVWTNILRYQTQVDATSEDQANADPS